MAITDINISDTLETGAPSITYEGNEGPQDPRQEQMVAQLKEEYKKYVFEMQEQGLEPMSFQQFIEQVMAEGQMSSAQPMPNRQMAAYGGIMDLGGRRRYGFGSSIKKKIRNIIPNEVADIAVKAAPFVAPFNPIAGGLMAGLGGFDQHGSISKGLKSGLMTYGMGQLGRKVGGAEMQTGWKPWEGMDKMKYGLSKPYVPGEDVFSKTIDRFSPKDTVVDETLKMSTDLSKGNLNPWDTAETIKAAKDAGKGNSLHNFLKGIGMNTAAMAGIVGASTLAGLYTKKNPADDSIEQMRGKGLDIESIRTEVTEAMKDSSGKLLEEIRIKYPFLGAQETKNIDIMAEGGRAGFYEGGLSIPSENSMEDARKTAMQDRLGGITEVMKQADLYRQGDVGQMYMAEGGLMDLGGMEKDYRNDGGFVPIGGKEKADDVPARLSKNEFVFTADAVRGAGGGDIDKGAEIMENVMKNLEQGGQISEESQGLSGAQEMFDVSERLSEVV